MRENRTWEQMRADNVGAAWIEGGGDFCSSYARNIMRYILEGDEKYITERNVSEFKKEQELPGWKQVGFNGCWSCDNSLTCEKYQNTFNFIGG